MYRRMRIIIRRMIKMKENNNIGNLPGYSKLGDDWKNLIQKTVSGFKSREEYYSWIVDLQAVSMARVPQNIIHLLMSEDFFQAAYNILTGTKPGEIEARKLLIRKIVEKAVPEAFNFFSSRAQEIQEKEPNFRREEEF